jgi:hypothetical protein
MCDVGYGKQAAGRGNQKYAEDGPDRWESPDGGEEDSSGVKVDKGEGTRLKPNQSCGARTEPDYQPNPTRQRGVGWEGPEETLSGRGRCDKLPWGKGREKGSDVDGREATRGEEWMMVITDDGLRVEILAIQVTKKKVGTRRWAGGAHSALKRALLAGVRPAIAAAGYLLTIASHYY